MASQQLPPLTSTVQIDTKQLADALKAIQDALKNTNDALKTLSNQSQNTGNQAKSDFQKIKDALDAVDKAVTGTTGKVSKFGSTINTAMQEFKGGGILGGLSSALGNVPLPLVGALGAVVGLGAGLEKLVVDTANYSSKIAKSSELTGISTDKMQLYTGVAKGVGLEQEDLVRTLLNFQRNLASGGMMLTRLGLNMKDVGITSQDTNTALMQFSGWLSTTKDAALANSAGLALLGRNGVTMLDALKLGPPFFAQYQKEMQKYGLILDDTAIKQGAMATAAKSELGMAIQGLERQVAGPAMAAFAQLFMVITQGVTSGQGLFHNLGETIGKVVGGIASFTSGLFGLGITSQTMTDASHTAAEELAGLVQGQSAASDTGQTQVSTHNDQKEAIDELARSTQLQTQAIDDSIKAIQKQTDGYDAQIKTLQDVQNEINNQIKLQDLQQQLADENGTSYLAQLKSQLAAVTDTYVEQRKAGESIADYTKRMKEEDLGEQIKTEEDKRTVQKTSTQIYQEQLKEQTDAQVEYLTQQKAGYTSDTKARLDALNQQKTDLQRNLSDAQAAQKAATDASKVDYQDLSSSATGSLGNVTNAGKDSGGQIANSYSKGADDAGAAVRDKLGKLATWIHDSFFGTPAQQKDAADKASAFGAAIGGAIIGGMASGMAAAAKGPGQDFMDWLTGMGKGKGQGGPGDVLNSLSDLIGGKLGSYTGGPTDYIPGSTHQAAGGPVNMGAAYIVGERGPELFSPNTNGTIIPNHQLGGMGHTINVTVYSNADPAEIAREIAWQLKVAA